MRDNGEVHDDDEADEDENDDDDDGDDDDVDDDDDDNDACMHSRSSAHIVIVTHCKHVLIEAMAKTLSCRVYG